MWSADTLKKYATVDPITAGEEQLTAAYVKAVNKGDQAAIGGALIAHFLERRGFTFDEAAKRTERSASSLKRDAARATVLMELPESDAITAWSHLSGMKDTDARALGESLALHVEADRLGVFIEYAATQVVEARCAEWDEETKANAVAHIVSRGIATAKRMKDALFGFAEHYGLTLPEVKRKPNPEEGATTPTAARVATAAALFQKDREQGSEGETFALSDAEAADLVRAVETSIRTLRMAGRVEDLDTIAGFLAESVALLDA